MPDQQQTCTVDGQGRKIAQGEQERQEPSVAGALTPQYLPGEKRGEYQPEGEAAAGGDHRKVKARMTDDITIPCCLKDAGKKQSCDAR